ncbi:hypothetical protein M5J20_09770 [Corynebacterium sp. TA-R-1]|uniref:GNAT family N-acetyltransferase n=1 Tax=Corynebacterium stercoris TaxID=2943490 RepID=A0ABT1G3B2_9CORY|nr:hypothetical protein [Corynebacterium stercoris]
MAAHRDANPRRDAHAHVVALRAGELGHLHPRTASGVFWEFDPLTTGVDETNPEIDKEAWMVALAYRQDPIGFSIVDGAVDDVGEGSRALATVLFCPAADAPGAVRMPTAPVSADAWLVTSLHIDAAVRRRGWESVLLDSVIGAATAAGVAALEVFGLRDDIPTEGTSAACRELAEQAPAIGLTEISILESAGFKVHVDHLVIPRLRLALPPQFDLLTAHEIAELLAEIPAR